MYIYAETPLHPGSGTAISGAVDLPIQRERHTEFPIIQGSSLKGVLRNFACWIKIDDKCENCDKKQETKDKCEILKTIFGSQDNIGGISITDARILAYPVRTLKGVFGWITCPIVLDRYKRDLTLANLSVNWSIPKPTSDEEVKICKNSNLTEDYVYIEDLQLKCSEDENVNKIAEYISRALPNSGYKEIKEKLKKDLVIVSDNVFRDLVSLTTEIITRIRIDPFTGTVDKRTGGLWTEEYLPTDTLMYALILIPSKLDKMKPENVENKMMSYDEKILQIGGDETIGKGFARVRLAKKEGD